MVRPASKAVRYGRPTAKPKHKKKFRPVKHEPVVITRVGDPKARTGLPKQAYARYINSPEWRQRRVEWFERNARMCRDCNKVEGVMHLHHVTYVRLGCEEDADLVCLCPTCHKRRHILGK